MNAPSVATLNFFDTLYLNLFRPGGALKQCIHRRYFWQAAVTLWLGGSFLTFSQAHGAAVGLRLAMTWLGGFLLWWLGTLMLHFCADLFGGQGRFADLMTATGLAFTPLLLSAPLSALPNALGGLGHTLSLLGWLGLGFWILALLALYLSKAESFSLDRALGALILSASLTGALVFALGVLGMLQIFAWGAMFSG
jgi:hypothetical protein